MQINEDCVFKTFVADFDFVYLFFNKKVTFPTIVEYPTFEQKKTFFLCVAKLKFDLFITPKKTI